MGCFSPKPGATKGDGQPESGAVPATAATSSRKSLDKRPLEEKDDVRNKVHVPAGEEQKVLEQVITNDTQCWSPLSVQLLLQSLKPTWPHCLVCLCLCSTTQVLLWDYMPAHKRQ